MAVVVHFSPRGLTMERYQEMVRRTAGPEFRRPGHIGHLCFGDPDDLQIISVWQNRETWDRYFSELIQPIAEELGIDFGNQTVYEAHHLRLASESLVPQ
jgi:hypothetical protein